MYKGSKKGTSTWETITKKEYELYQKAPFSRLWKVKEVKSTPPLPEVKEEEKPTKKK